MKEARPDFMDGVVAVDSDFHGNHARFASIGLASRQAAAPPDSGAKVFVERTPNFRRG